MTTLPLKVPELVLVGSSGRNAGKTTAATAIIEALGGENHVVALKVTTAGEIEASCPRGGDGCGACAFGEGFVLERELDPASGKDTGRLLAAGAEMSYWLRARDETLADGFKEFAEKVPAGSVIIAESNSLRGSVEPGLFVMLTNLDEPTRPSAEKVGGLADLEIKSRGPIGPDTARALAARLKVARGPSSSPPCLSLSQESAPKTGLKSEPKIERKKASEAAPILKSVSLEEALDFLLARTAPVDRSERVPLIEALGLISAEKVLAAVDNPPFDRSPLDGFALRSEDSASASKDNPVRLKIVDTLYAGEAPARALERGEALKLMTGAPMPEGSDCVIAKERTLEEGCQVEIHAPLAPFENYVFKGEDIRRGAVFIKEGDRLDHVRLGMLAAMGHANARVWPAPIAGLASVGDELAFPGEPLPPGMIYNSNGITLGARLLEYGLAVRPHVVLKDDPELVAESLAEMLDRVDVVLTSGSVSVGDKDVLPEALRILGAELEIASLAFKPGSAFLCASHKGKRIFCLSGNPFAALATLELVARPALAKLSRQERLKTKRGKAVIRDAFPGGRGKTRRFLRARLIDREGNLPEVALPEGHASGRLFSIAGCDCLVDLASDAPNPAPGDVVDVVKLSLPV